MRQFADLIERQIALFREDYAELIERCDEAELAYDRAPREEAEGRYAEYLELVEQGTAALAELRDTYAQTLEPDLVESYEAAFEREVNHHLPQFALGL